MFKSVVMLQYRLVLLVVQKLQTAAFKETSFFNSTLSLIIKRLKASVSDMTFSCVPSPMLAMMLCTGRREGASYTPVVDSPLLCFSSCLKMKAEFSSLVMLM